MLKKLVALTLAALMLINPMTAFAVTWDNMLQGLAVAREQGGNKYEEDGVTLEVEGTSAKIYGDGLLEDFYNVEEFTSYTFSGNITVGGETFEVYVYDVPVRDEHGTPIFNEDGSMQRQAQQAVVNVESGVAITATEVRFGVDDNSTLKVTTKGSIGFDADGTLVTERVSFDVNEEATANAEMTVVNEGEIATIENIWMGADGEGTINVTNDGTMTTENEIGMHVHGSAEGTLTNNGTLTANASGLGEEGAQVGIGVHGEGTATLINSESGVINSELSGWLDSDATDGTLNMANDGTVNGNMGAWGFEGGYEDEEGNWVESTTGGEISLENTGDVTGSLGTFTNDNISSSVTNSGTAENMFADNNGAGDITIANDGEVTDFSAGANGEGNVTATNSGTVHNEMWVGSIGSGTIEATNSGTVEGYMNLYQEGDGAATLINEGTTNEMGSYITDTATGTVSVTNENEVEYIWTRNEGSSELNVTNNGTAVELTTVASGDAQVTMTNNGEVEWLYSGVEGNAAVLTTNNGTATDFHSDVHGEGYLTQINEGEVTNQFSGVANDGAILNNVNNGTAAKLGTDANGESTATMVNTGSITEAAWNTATGEAQVSASNSGDINYLDASAADSSTASLSNAGTGTVNEIYSFAGGEGAQVKVTNEGTTEWIFVDAADSGSVTVTNASSGTISDVTNVANTGGTTTVINDGTVVGDMWSHADEGGNVVSINNGTVSNQGGYSETDGTTVSVENNGTVDGWLEAYMYGDGTAEVVNNGHVEIKVNGIVGGEGTVTAVNSSTGTIGDGVQNEDNPPDGLWVGAENGGTGTAINEGTINGEVGGGSWGEGSAATVTNNGSADSAWLDSYDGGSTTLENNTEIAGETSVAVDGTGSMSVQNGETGSTNQTVFYINAESGTDLTPEKIAEIVAGTDVEVKATDKIQASIDGNAVAEYEVTENGEIVLVKDYTKADGVGVKVTLKEMVRHAMEEARKAAAIGGVTGSPFWLKQLYLGYMSLNLRLFNGEEQLLFKESISWVPGTGEAGEKVLTLRVKLEDTANLAMRLDGAVIDKLEQAGIVEINILDGNGNLFMNYKTADLKDARAMYGLTAKEYIVVGSADADVMKIAEDGTISPIEGETEEAAAEETVADAEPVEAAAEEAAVAEAEPVETEPVVEEVADEAAEEPAEEAAEQTPAA